MRIKIAIAELMVINGQRKLKSSDRVDTEVESYLTTPFDKLRNIEVIKMEGVYYCLNQHEFVTELIRNGVKEILVNELTIEETKERYKRLTKITKKCISALEII